MSDRLRDIRGQLEGRLFVSPRNEGAYWRENAAMLLAEIDRLGLEAGRWEMKSEELEVKVEGLKREVDRLRALNEWQPIETAPRDGTQIITWDPGTGIGTTCYRVGPNQNCWVAWETGECIEPPTRWQPPPNPPEAP